MRRIWRPVAAVTSALAGVSVAYPAGAHTLSGEVDAPLPLAAYLIAAAVAVALSIAFAVISDSAPAPEPVPGPVRILPKWLRLLLRLVGLVAWTWVVLQTIAGGSSDAEVASLVLWVFGWVALALTSALIGPVWSWLDPFSTLYDLLAVPARALHLRIPGRAPWHRRAGVWLAVLTMVFFVWLELGAGMEGGRALGLVLIGYTLLTLSAMAWYGRDRWREHAEVFSVWFGVLGRLASWGLVASRDSGQMQRRGFGRALLSERWSASLLVLVTVATGSVIWDGVSQTKLFFDLVGDSNIVMDSLLLVAFLALLCGLVLLVGRASTIRATGAGLVPVAVGYLVAHYLTWLLTEGQRIAVAVSDPLQQGWDLIGTATWQPLDDWAGSSAVWTLQVVAVVLGHVVGAWIGHGAIRSARAKGRSVRQWPLAALMISLTVLTLWSLGQNLVFVSEAESAATALASAVR